MSSAAPRFKPRCLLLTADAYCRAVMADIFDDYGVPVISRPSLKAFAAANSDDRSDVVIIDDDLGDMTPFEAVRIVRASAGAEPPFKAILLSAKVTRRTVDTAKKAGFDALIAKPVAPAPLMRTLKTLTPALPV